MVLAQTDCDWDKTAVLVLYGVQKHRRYLFKPQGI
jgi:hypothetical protein